MLTAMRNVVTATVFALGKFSRWQDIKVSTVENDVFLASHSVFTKTGKGVR